MYMCVYMYICIYTHIHDSQMIAVIGPNRSRTPHADLTPTRRIALLVLNAAREMAVGATCE